MVRAPKAGFTLIELLVVMAILATLLSLAVPRYLGSVDKAKEAVLQENLASMRSAIDKFYGDSGRYPESVDELVQKRYLRSLPLDPITQATDSWTIVPPPPGAKGAVADVKSGAQGLSRKGTPYAEW